MTNNPTTKANHYLRSFVRHITFRTARGIEGCVTGTPLTPHDDGFSLMKVRLYSAGCHHGIYTLPVGSTIVSADRY